MSSLELRRSKSGVISLECRAGACFFGLMLFCRFAGSPVVDQVNLVDDVVVVYLSVKKAPRPAPWQLERVEATLVIILRRLIAHVQCS